MIVSEADAMALPNYRAYEVAEKFFRPLVEHTGGYAVHNAEALRPLNGRGYILGPNHRSNWDSIVLGLAMLDLPDLTQNSPEGSLEPRAIHYMAKDTLWRYPGMRNFIEACGAFSVKRGQGIGLEDGKVSHIEDLVEKKAVKGIYSEGHRERKDLEAVDSTKLKTSIAWLALKYGIPIVPVGIAGRTGRFQRKLPRTVMFGEPIYVERVSTGDESEFKEKKTDLMVVLHGEIDQAYQEARRLHEEQFGIAITA